MENVAVVYYSFGLFLPNDVNVNYVEPPFLTKAVDDTPKDPDEDDDGVTVDVSSYFSSPNCCVRS